MDNTYKNYVVGFCFDFTLTQVVLVKKCKPKWQDGLLNGVGGQIEGNETPAQAMAREFWEETGLPPVLTPWHHFLTGDITVHQGNCIVEYLVACSNIESCKFDQREQCAWYSVEHLPENIVPNIPWLLAMAKLKFTNPEWSEPAKWVTI